MNDFERQWAVALKKSQIKNKQTKIIPVDVWEKQVQEEINYFKTELKKYIAVKNKEKIKEILEKLFTLRAEQMIISLRKEQEKKGFYKDKFAQQEMTNYIKDCYKLTQATKILFNK